MKEIVVSSLAQELGKLNENRAHVYAFLSRCYEREVDASFAHYISDRFQMESSREDISSAIGHMIDELADCDERKIEALAVVFNRAFFGMGPKTSQKAFPYESVYTSQEGILMQAAYSKTIEFYRNTNLCKNPDFTEPEDHLAVQLSYMDYLCTRCAALLLGGDMIAAERLIERQQIFLEKHLLNWIRPFTEDLRQAAEEGFYFHLANATQVFLEEDILVVHDMLGV